MGAFGLGRFIVPRPVPPFVPRRVPVEQRLSPMFGSYLDHCQAARGENNGCYLLFCVVSGVGVSMKIADEIMRGPSRSQYHDADWNRICLDNEWDVRTQERLSANCYQSRSWWRWRVTEWTRDRISVCV
jgi:hypothetical protein